MNEIVTNAEVNEIVKVENGEIVISPGVEKKIIEFTKLEKEVKYQKELLKAGLTEALNITGKKNYIGNGISATLRSGSEKTTIDSKRLKAECPEIWQSYSTTTKTSPSLVLTVAE